MTPAAARACHDDPLRPEGPACGTRRGFRAPGAPEASLWPPTLWHPGPEPTPLALSCSGAGVRCLDRAAQGPDTALAHDDPTRD